MKPSTTWIYKLLHFGLTLSLPFLLLAILSCKKAKEEKEDLGPEYSSDDVIQALSKVPNQAGFDHTAVGQFVEYVTTQRIESEERVSTLEGLRVEVIRRTDNPTTVVFDLKISRAKRLSEDNWERTVSEEPLTLIKQPALNFLSVNSPALTLAAKVAEARARVGAMANERVTYHRLRESDETLQAPQLVRLRADCGGLSPCEIPVHYVRFDMVLWKSDEDYDKVSFDLGFSTVTPYLPFGTNFEQFNGVLVTDCRSTYLPIQGRSYYVRECTNVEDLQK